MNRAMTKKKPNAITLFQQRWPDYQTFADDLGVSTGLVQTWRVRNAMPAVYNYQAAVAAERRKIGKFKAVMAELQAMRVAA